MVDLSQRYAATRHLNNDDSKLDIVSPDKDEGDGDKMKKHYSRLVSTDLVRGVSYLEVWLFTVLSYQTSSRKRAAILTTSIRP
jgi:hypothetical protein